MTIDGTVKDCYNFNRHLQTVSISITKEINYEILF